jgi:hypothetical protein
MSVISVVGPQSLEVKVRRVFGGMLYEEKNLLLQIPPLSACQKIIDLH